jgi:hypothetical protein
MVAQKNEKRWGFLLLSYYLFGAWVTGTYLMSVRCALLSVLLKFPPQGFQHMEQTLWKSIDQTPLLVSIVTLVGHLLVFT